ncbi:MAG: Gfo/Idh/MocA family oxidoreductase [Bauldia sp.]|nr:Gfo/Idh/MocA family oxidoreductase [Bauldia sp.]
MSERLRWGVLGAAGIARGSVVPAIQSSRNGHVVAVASRNPADADAWARAIGISRVVGAYDTLLGATDIDAVYVPLPNSLHGEWAIRAAQAGKAVLCEKPLARDASEAERIVSAFEEAGKQLMEGFMYRFHPQHARVRKLLGGGAIGELREVHAHLSVDIMNPADPSNVRFVPELGGGARLDMGCYVASIARFLFGDEPESVIGTLTMDETFGVDVGGSAILSFDRERTASISCSFASNGQGFYRLIGRNGMIDVPRAILPGLGDRASDTLIIDIDSNGRRRSEELPPVDQYRLMVEAFADSVLADAPVPIAPTESILNLKVLDAWQRAAETGTRAAV